VKLAVPLHLALKPIMRTEETPLSETKNKLSEYQEKLANKY
jgi:hypothetical protein